MAKKKAGSSSKGASRQATRRRDNDQPELDYLIANGRPLWARLIENRISGSEVVTISVVPTDGSTPFTVIALDNEDFVQSSRPVWVPNRIKVDGLVALQIRWDRTVSAAQRMRGIASGKLTITIRPGGQEASTTLDELVYEPINVYIDD